MTGIWFDFCADSWIANYHEHETLLQENEAERLSKEEQDMAWQTYRRSLEWEEVHRTTLDDGDRVANSNTPPEIIVSQQTKGSSRSRPVKQRKCTNLAHLLTLRSQGIKPGFSTVCGECSQEISWENLNRDGRSRWHHWPFIRVFFLTCSFCKFSTAYRGGISEVTQNIIRWTSTIFSMLLCNLVHV